MFIGKAGCVACHEVGKASALLTDNRMHNTGTGYRESMGIRIATQRVTLAPGIVVDVDMDLIDSVGEALPSDLGLYEGAITTVDPISTYAPNVAVGGNRPQRCSMERQ